MHRGLGKGSGSPQTPFCSAAVGGKEAWEKKNNAWATWLKETSWTGRDGQ